MKQIYTLFNARKAKQLLKDNLKIKARQRYECIEVEDEHYDDALRLLKRKEINILKHDVRICNQTIWFIEKWFKTHKVMTDEHYKMLKEMADGKGNENAI